MASEHEIQKKNLEADLSLIRSEIDIESKKLSSILSSIDAHKAAQKEFEQSKKDFEDHKRKENDDLALKRSEIQKAENDSQLKIAFEKKQLDELKRDVKEANRELAWINQKIMNGQDELESILKKKLGLDDEVAKLLELVANTEDEQDKLEQIVSKRSSIEAEMHDKAVASEEIVSQHRDQLNKLIADLAAKTSERDRVQSELKTYTDQLYTAMNDYHIIRTRLEQRWKEHYPELDLPLMPSGVL